MRSRRRVMSEASVRVGGLIQARSIDAIAILCLEPNRHRVGGGQRELFQAKRGFSHDFRELLVRRGEKWSAGMLSVWQPDQQRELLNGVVVGDTVSNTDVFASLDDEVFARLD